MATFKPLSRAQLAKICPDEESIRFFEKLFRQAGTDTPDLVDDTEAKAEYAVAAVNALSQVVAGIASSLELLEIAPAVKQEEAPEMCDQGRIAELEARVNDLIEEVEAMKASQVL